MDKIVTIPIYLREHVMPIKKGYPKKANFMVFDTETESATTGRAYLLTFYDGRKPSYLRILEKDIEYPSDSYFENGKVEKKTVLSSPITRMFFNVLREKCRRGYNNVLFAHNLWFDLTAVLGKLAFEIFIHQRPFPFHVWQNKEFLGTVRVFHRKQLFARVDLPNRATVKIVDTGNFIKGSLYNISRQLDLPCKKRKRPDFVTLGRKPKNKKEWTELIRYCGDEIKAQYELSKFILEKMHKAYDVPFSVSSAHLSSYVFRKHFMKEPITQIRLASKPEELAYIIQRLKEEHHVSTHYKLYSPIGLAEMCIHGGRAKCFSPLLIPIPNVRMYDFNSFYPYAMTLIPPVTKGKWVEVNEFDENHEGFYRVSGHVEKCKYPIILKSYKTFEFANGEPIFDVSITSYELKEALRSKEFWLEEIHGFVWKPSKDAENPFKDYVEDLYEKKSKCEMDSPLYLTYKLFLNSLYGKTYQTLRHVEYDETPDYRINLKTNRAVKIPIRYRGGGMYLPHIGSWITSICRAILHRYLHRYQALDCSTDSFKTHHRIRSSNKLGKLKLVYKNGIPLDGLLLSLRPKLYVFFSKDVEKKVAQDFNGDLRGFLKENLGSLNRENDILHYALHGFRGNV